MTLPKEASCTVFEPTERCIGAHTLPFRVRAYTAPGSDEHPHVEAGFGDLSARFLQHQFCDHVRRDFQTLVERIEERTGSVWSDVRI